VCESNVYLLRDGYEELFMENVNIIEPREGEIYLKSIFGEQKIISAKIKQIRLLDHKIILEKSSL